MAWLAEADQGSLFVSVLTIGELAKGVAKYRRRDPRAADSLAHWLRGIETLFSDHVLPIDGRIATAWGELSAHEPLPVIDALLAATAQVHGLTIVTRNVSDIERTGVPHLNPWNPH